MRDVGLMGENTFSQLCAEVGLIANNSNVDKAGWDFLVEFPMSQISSVHDTHKGALECKVQVKSTDKRDRKITVTLSNLRRLVTYGGPAFLVFMEFDGQSHVNSIFVVHVDKQLMKKVIKKLHELEQSAKDNNFNKRTMTIRYSEKHLLNCSTGSCLVKSLKEYIGSDIASYISEKKRYLEATGFEEGRGLFTFKLDGPDNLSALIAASLGVKEEIRVKNVVGKEKRFGIESKQPFIEASSAMVNISNVKPTTHGTLFVKEDELSIGLEFDIAIYTSQFSVDVPDDLKQFRIEAGTFELLVSPYKGKARYEFKLDSDDRFEIKKLKATYKFLKLLSGSHKPILGIIQSERLPELEFHLGQLGEEFGFEEQLSLLDSAIWLLAQFEVSAPVYGSLSEIEAQSLYIFQLKELMLSPKGSIKIHYRIEGGTEVKSDIACVSIAVCRICSYVLGIVFVVVGSQIQLQDDSFELTPDNIHIEKKIAVKTDGELDLVGLKKLASEVAEKYKASHFVITQDDYLDGSLSP